MSLYQSGKRRSTSGKSTSGNRIPNGTPGSTSRRAQGAIPSTVDGAQAGGERSSPRTPGTPRGFQRQVVGTGVRHSGTSRQNTSVNQPLLPAMDTFFPTVTPEEPTAGKPSPTESISPRPKKGRHRPRQPSFRFTAPPQPTPNERHVAQEHDSTFVRETRTVYAFLYEELDKAIEGYGRNRQIFRSAPEHVAETWKRRLPVIEDLCSAFGQRREERVEREALEQLLTGLQVGKDEVQSRRYPRERDIHVACAAFQLTSDILHNSLGNRHDLYPKYEVKSVMELAQFVYPGMRFAALLGVIRAFKTFTEPLELADSDTDYGERVNALVEQVGAKCRDFFVTARVPERSELFEGDTTAVVMQLRQTSRNHAILDLTETIFKCTGLQTVISKKSLQAITHLGQRARDEILKDREIVETLRRQQ